MRRYLLAVGAALAAACMATGARASMGLDEIRGANADDSPVTVFYPAAAPETDVTRGPFTMRLANRAAPIAGNGYLVVFSHGSGGSPWTHADLARKLVAAGFTVAVPEHRGDNWHSHGDAGPESWKRRPREVSRAIDVIAETPRFGGLVKTEKVGVWGMSAGGHTALTVAGGMWSPSELLRHCEAHLDDDFPSCVGLALQLDGGMLDGLKKAAARTVIRFKLADTQWYGHTDKRIAAVVAEVPFAVDFNVATLTKPRVPLGIIQAGQDAWLAPRFHSGPVLAACTPCERVADVPSAGHASFFSPQLPKLEGYLKTLLADPPGFDRTQVPAVHERIVQFFQKHLLR